MYKIYVKVKNEIPVEKHSYIWRRASIGKAKEVQGDSAIKSAIHIHARFKHVILLKGNINDWKQWLDTKFPGWKQIFSFA